MLLILLALFLGFCGGLWVQAKYNIINLTK